MAHHPNSGGLRHVVVLGVAAIIACSAVLPGRLSRPAVGAVAPVEVPAAVPAGRVGTPDASPAVVPGPSSPGRAAAVAPAVRTGRARSVVVAATGSPAAVSPVPNLGAPATAASPALPTPSVQIAAIVSAAVETVDGSESKQSSSPGETTASALPERRVERVRPERRAPVATHRQARDGGRGHDDRRAARD